MNESNILDSFFGIGPAYMHVLVGTSRTVQCVVVYTVAAMEESSCCGGGGLTHG